MRYAITKRNTPQTHLKPRYTKELPVRTCAERAHAYACAGRQTLARFARSGAPGSLRCPSDPRSLRSLGSPPFPPMPLQMRSYPLARSARSGFLPPSCSGNPCTTSSGQGKRLRNRISTPPSPIPSDAPPNRSASVPGLRSLGTRHGRQSCLNAIPAPFAPTPMLHSKRLQASWGQAPSPPARAFCARSLRSLAGSHAACATRGRSPAALCWLAGYALRCARVSRSLGSRFAPAVC